MPPNSQPQPLVSALIVVRNEVVHIERCLRSVLAQTLDPHQYEIIVVDGLSVDGTREQVEQIIAEQPHRHIRLLDNARHILSSGWNIGIRAARGTYVVRPDAHAIIPPDFLAHNLAVMNSHPEATAVGGVLKTVGQGFWGTIIAAALSSPFGVGASRFRVGGQPGPADTVVFGLYKRQALLEVGGFDEDLPLNQDVVCHAKLKASGAILYFDPSIRSTYFCRSSLGALFKRTLRGTLWLVPMLRRHTRHSFAWRYVIPLGFVLSLLVLAAAGIWYRPAWIGLAGLLGVYFACAFFFAFRTDLPVSRRLLVPVACFVTHVAYGLGTLASILLSPILTRRFRARASSAA